MARLRRGSSLQGLGRSQSLRRETAWIQGPGGTGATAISTSSAAFVGSGIAPAVEGLTCVRIRGELLGTLITATGSLDGFRGAFGIGIVSSTAFGVGIGSVPTPITDQAFENWLYWTPLQVIAHISTEADFGLEAALRMTVDSKAMRKFPSDMVIYSAMEVVEVGAAVMDLSFDSRMLVKLP